MNEQTQRLTRQAVHATNFKLHVDTFMLLLARLGVEMPNDINDDEADVAEEGKMKAQLIRLSKLNAALGGHLDSGSA